MGLRHKIWREELYQKLKDYPGPIKKSDIRKKFGCGMDINYAMKKIMEEHMDVLKFSYGRDVYYRVIPEIVQLYALVDFDRFRIGKEKLNERKS